MNDHFGKILHQEKTAQWRREAADARLIAEAGTDRPSFRLRGGLPRFAIGRRIAAAVSGILPGR